MNAPKQMTVEWAMKVRMPFGKQMGLTMADFADKWTETFCKLMARRGKLYGRLRAALDALHDGELHKAALREKAYWENERRNQRLLDNARLR